MPKKRNVKKTKNVNDLNQNGSNEIVIDSVKSETETAETSVVQNTPAAEFQEETKAEESVNQENTNSVEATETKTKDSSNQEVEETKMKKKKKKTEKTETGSSIEITEEQVATKEKKKRHPFRIFFATLITLICLLGLVGGCGGLYIAYTMIQDAPEMKPTDFISEESSKLLDADGNVIVEIGTYLRENISYEQMPESLIDAFVAIEDSRFFKHPGFDLPRFTKAALVNLKNRDFSQGGSTFTMQLVKNTYFVDDDEGQQAEKKVSRKVQEIWLSLNLEKMLKKEDIFTLYLNKVNFGGNIRGVQKAAMYYFGKEAKDLTLSESALLAGIVNRPNAYNPYNHLDNATVRRNQVLDMMLYHGFISETECKLAKSIAIEDQLVGESRMTRLEGYAYQSYIDAAIEEVMELTGHDPATTSMTIYTSMNRTIQEGIDAIQNDEYEGVEYCDDLVQVAMISVDNKTGDIVGIGGGRNYDGARLLNRATSQFKQPGSAVKPFLSYALAFEYLGWSTKHVVTDRPLTYRGQSRVIQNASRTYQGDMLLEDAIGNSVNTTAISALQDVIEAEGVETVVEYLHDLGFTKIRSDYFDESAAIGGAVFETTVKEMAGAHATMMNNGYYIKPHAVQKIVYADGTEFVPDYTPKQVVSSATAYMVATLMENAVSGPYFNYMQILKRDYPVYGKTGTTDWGSSGLQYGIPKGAMKDKWMVSETDRYTNVLWLGYDKGIKDKDTYFHSWKNRMNIQGHISKALLDIEEKAMLEAGEELPGAVERPDDVADITYILGTWPYAYPTGGFTTVTGMVRDKYANLVNVYDYAKTATKLTGFGGHFNEDGSYTLNWTSDLGGYGDTKDISLHDQYGNHVEAWGRNLFSYAWVSGAQSFKADIFHEGAYYKTVYGSGSFSEWDETLTWGSVKACGSFASGGNQICVTLR